MNEGEYICKSCGAKKIVITKETKSYLSECSVCGKQISSMAEVCPNCGQKTYVGGKREEEKVKFLATLIATVCTLIGAFLLFTSMPVTSSTKGKFVFDLGRQIYYFYTGCIYMGV